MWLSLFAKKIYRKENVLSPYNSAAVSRIPEKTGGKKRRRALFLTSFIKGLLTLEASIELPFFLICMVVVLHYSNVLTASVEFSDGLCQTAEEMALIAYKDEYSDANGLIRGAISDAYARSQVIDRAEHKDAVKNATFLNSSYMKEGDKIRLVLSYQVKNPFPSIPVPHTFFIQKAVIRGWTGRSGISPYANSSWEENEENQYVYVTDWGTVYHTDPDCTHLKLIIQEVSRNELIHARNASGGKYHACEHCAYHYGQSHQHGYPAHEHIGSGSSDTFYICPFGDSFHCSLDCPGLKRSVNKVKLRDCEGLCECADCKARREQAASKG